MISKINIFICIVLILYAALGIGMAFLGNIHTDESWWFYGSTLVPKGQHPHFDFISHHNPVFYYLYAIPQYVFGNSLIVARLTSLFFALLTFFVALRLSFKKTGWSGLLLAAILFLTNIYVLYCYTIVHYQALETLILTVILAIVFGETPSRTKAFWISVLGVLLMGVRYPVELIPLLFFFYLAWVAVRYLKHPAFSRIAVGTAVISLLIIYGPYLLFIPDKFFTNTIWYILKMESFKELFGLGGFSLTGILITRLTWIKEAFNNYVAIYGILGTVGLAVLFKTIHVPVRYVGLVLFTIIIECFYLIPHSSGLASFTSFIFPLMVFLAVIGLKSVSSDNNRELIFLKRGFIASLLTVGLVLQIPVGAQNTFAYTWVRSDVKNAYEVAQKIKSLVPPEGKILTFTPIFAALADRQVVHGLEMELASFFPTWPTEKARYHDMMNIEMLEDTIFNRSASAIVLTEKRFFEDLGYARILQPYRNKLVTLIEANYHLVEKIEVPHSIHRGDVFIYLPRPQ